MTCQAEKYGYCAGTVDLKNVLYKYVNARGTCFPADIVPFDSIPFDSIPIEICEFHYNYLVKHNGGNIPEMTGKFVDETVEKVLFAPFHTLTGKSKMIVEVVDEHKESFKNFENCLDFIDWEIGSDLWSAKPRLSSDLTNGGLYKIFRQFTAALLADDEETIQALKSADRLSNITLLSTYVMANHELFSVDNTQDISALMSSVRLVELFVEAGLEKDLLVLAISGERQRDLSIHRIDESNVLHPNLFVVQTLVPQYISPHETVYYNDPQQTYDDIEPEVRQTALQYWHDFSNYMWYIGSHFASGSNKELGTTFYKNEDIRLYLESVI